MTNARGPWSNDEDDQLRMLVGQHGASNWVKISKELRTRSPKQCRERWHQNLKPGLNLQPITEPEGHEIEKLHAIHGPRWAEIARIIGNRSDNAIKNWWNGGVNRRKRRDTKHSQPSVGGPQRSQQQSSSQRYAPYPSSSSVAPNAQVDPNFYAQRSVAGRPPVYPHQSQPQHHHLMQSGVSSDPSSPFPIGFDAMPPSYHSAVGQLQQQQQLAQARRAEPYRQRPLHPMQVPSLSPDCGSASSHGSPSSAQIPQNGFMNTYVGPAWQDSMQSSYGPQQPVDHADSSYSQMSDNLQKVGFIDPEVGWNPYDRPPFQQMQYHAAPQQLSSYFPHRDHHANLQAEQHDLAKRTSSGPMAIANLVSH